jgi:Txe/YoeB family toxin of Txe-Axe toxin-antitoxin module
MEVQVIQHNVLDAYAKKRGILRSWKKSLGVFIQNPRHPSLHAELLQPAHRGISSFRINNKYRALYTKKGDTVFIFQITNHYKK